MDKKILEVLRAAGDFYAGNPPRWTSDIIERLNPYYFADPDAQPPRPSETTKVRAVEFLLSLIRDSSGIDAEKQIRESLRFRYEIHEASQTPAIWELDEERWLRYADMVCIRALEKLRVVPAMDRIMTTLEVERAYGLAPGTAKKAAQRGSIPAQKRGHDWLIAREDAEKRWGQK